MQKYFVSVEKYSGKRERLGSDKPSQSVTKGGQKNIVRWQVSGLPLIEYSFKSRVLTPRVRLGTHCKE